MYYYLYDSFLADKKYAHVLARIETRLTDLGINGKINRLSFLKNIQQVLIEEVKRGVKTVVIVGNDKTLAQTINLVVDINAVIGFIPVETPSNIAKLLGIPAGEEACDILSARIVEKIDLGQVNNYYFFSSLEMGGGEFCLQCDNNYFINFEGNDNRINFSNLNFYRQYIARPNDGKMDIFIETRKKKMFKNENYFSHLLGQTIKISSKKPLPILLLDEKRIIKTPAIIETATKKIRMVVGKDRQY